MKKIYFAGGCFWGVQAFFKTIKGVIKTVVGYANSNVKNPLYSEVKSQTTTAVEAVEITYDEVLKSLKERDHLDSTRKESPLVKASDALELDTTNLKTDEVVNFISNEIEKRDC